jgi:hypothetical protein
MRAGGGTTTLVVNPFTRALERDFGSSSGTARRSAVAPNGSPCS